MTEVRLIGDLEKTVKSELLPRIADYMRLLENSYAISGAILESAFPARNPSLAKQVCTKLMMRMINDMRCISLLSEVGYDMQACALAASVYETAFTIGSIRDDDSLATEWMDHSDPKKSFKDVYTNTRTTILQMGGTEKTAEHIYKVYRQLCWSKHLNPISEQQGGMELTSEGVDFVPGPNSDELTERGVCFCCSYTVLFVTVALDTFLDAHVLAEQQGNLNEELKKLSLARAELHRRGLARWSGPDPFS